MNNFEKEFVPYTEALELKQLGFDEPCMASRDMNNKEGIIQIPLYQQAFRWFREKYGLRNRNYGSLNYSGTISEYFEIFQYAKGTSDKVLSIIVGSLTYEEAELACLRKLIEIVKQKQQ
jgi:hypothetical protein